MKFTPSLWLCLLFFGCSPPPARLGGFNSDNPASKLYAIMRAGETPDKSATAHLVEQLDSDDPLVRMMAINALERITHTRMGYNPYDSPIDRQPAIEQWTEAARKYSQP